MLTDETVDRQASAHCLRPSLARDYDFGLPAVKQPAGVLNGRKGLDADGVVPRVDASPRSSSQRLNPWQAQPSTSVSSQRAAATAEGHAGKRHVVKIHQGSCHLEMPDT
jgi:hypothetical protein